MSLDTSERWFESAGIVDYSELATTTSHNGSPPPDRRFPRLVDGATFIDGLSSVPDALWGEPGRILAAVGEPLMLVGPQGVGKTSVGQQLALARLGLREHVLGLPVFPDERRVLYLAMDRPRQAARSLARMIQTDSERKVLRERLLVYEGPPPFSVVKSPEALAEMALAVGAGLLVLDSYKDLVPGIAKDEIGAAVNIALQHVIAARVEITGLHHQRKANEGNKSPNSLDDVYGSVWLTSGHGSVVLLWGKPGDAFVELRHLKPPVEAVGPLNVQHNHARGVSSVVDEIALEELLAAAPVGLTAHDAAGQLFAKSEPDRNEVERARRRLERLVGEGTARRVEPELVTEAVRYRLEEGS